jgi:hypothetical protein
MFLTGVHTDLKVRRILRERLQEEAQEEKTWIDQNQQDLFAEESQDPTPPTSPDSSEREDPPTED